MGVFSYFTCLNPFNFFASLAELWYGYNLDVLNACKEAFARQNNGMRKKYVIHHLNSQKMYTPLQVDSLNAVFTMFQDMNISTRTASALVKVLCTDNDVSQVTRSKLVDLHQKYIRLRELIDSSSGNYEFDQRILQTNIYEIGLQFRLCLLQFLPVSNSIDELVKDIAKYQLTLDKYAVKHTMLNNSNLAHCDASTESFDKNDKLVRPLHLPPTSNETRLTSESLKTIPQSL